MPARSEPLNGQGRRHDVTAAPQISAGVSAISEVIDQLQTLPESDARNSAIAELEAQRANLALQAASGGTVSVSGIIASARQLVAQVSANTPAATTADRILLMSHADMAAMQQRYAAESAWFQHFETDQFAKLDALAEANGVDLRAYHAMRNQLRNEYENAQATGDHVGMAEADALRATNLRQGLSEAGAAEPDIDAARKEEARREQAYLDLESVVGVSNLLIERLHGFFGSRPCQMG